MSIVQGITLAIAILGAVLGIINTWKALDKDRLKIRVVPKIAFMPNANTVITRISDPAVGDPVRAGSPPEMLAIEVINLSSFPVTISDVGFGRADRERHTILQPALTGGKTWPARLAPREAVIALANPRAKLDPALLAKAVAYAKTDCGEVRYGTSPFFKEYVKNLRSIERKP